MIVRGDVRWSRGKVSRVSTGALTTRIAVLYPTDPAVHAPSGIDSFIRGLLKWAPAHLQYTLFGATSDVAARPIGRESEVLLGARPIRYVPLTALSPSTRKGLPLTVRYVWALRRYRDTGGLSDFGILDFHRIEPLVLFAADPRPKNVILHQDMSVLRDPNSDIMWRHAPWLYEAIERRLLTRVDRIFTVRDSAVRRYISLYPELAQRFSFIPTWVDAEVFRNPAERDRQVARAELISSLGARNAKRILVFVGRLDRQKDPLLLLQAFRELTSTEPGLHLVMIGDGVLRPKIKAMIRTTGMEKCVSLLGVRSAPDIARIHIASDLFVLSSAYEGMPIAVLEALATGLPVVSPDVGEIRRVVAHGVNGRIASSRSARDLAAAMRAALGEIETLRGSPCVSAVRPYHPQKILATLYKNHERQGTSGAA